MRFSAHLSFLFQELPLMDRLEAAARCGFDGVEFPTPFEIPAAEMDRRLRDFGLRYVQLGMRSAPGDRGLAAWVERRSEFRERLAEAVDYAAAIGCGLIHVPSGFRPPVENDQSIWDAYLEGIAMAADRAAANGIQVLIEPISAVSIPHYYLNTVESAERAVAELGRSDVKLLFDTFHFTELGRDPIAYVEKHMRWVGHVHYADHPGRHEPGTGLVRFDDLHAALEAAGYAGIVGCEYVPLRSTEQGLGWIRRFSDRPAGA